MAKVVPLYSPKETYMQYIARANRYILKQVINNLTDNDNEQR